MGYLEDHKEQIKNLNSLAAYYQNLSEIYILELQDTNRPVKLIQTIMGILVEMNSDLIAFQKKNKPTEKFLKQRGRLDLLIKCVNEMGNISVQNSMIKPIVSAYATLHRDKDAKIAELEAELLKLKENIEIYNM